MSKRKILLEESWKTALLTEFDQTYFQELRTFLITQKKQQKNIYPPSSLIFNAFNSTPFDKVKVVILGQDPYHRPNQAMGLSFSVPKSVRIPPSLNNIYKELEKDINFKVPSHGDLTSWATQGVFLLNAFLTVEAGKPGSHRNIGWGLFTDKVISLLSEQRQNIVFMLWGNFAKNKTDLINHSKHLVLTAAHPSPLARGAFFGSKHFSKANEYLISKSIKPIEWQI